jgi:hypothetical protein
LVVLARQGLALLVLEQSPPVLEQQEPELAPLEREQQGPELAPVVSG